MKGVSRENGVRNEWVRRGEQWERIGWDDLGTP